MDNTLQQKLADKNKKLIDMVIERAKRDFPEDIALIGLTGSFSTNDFHEKSDIDLIIVNNTDRGWQIGSCFIFDDVGYDIYCTPWDNLEKKAELDSFDVSVLTHLQVLYCAQPAYLDRLNGLKEKALQKLSEGITADSIYRADKYINLAKQDYADILLSNNLGNVRYASGTLLLNVINSIVSLNNTCIKRGVKRYLEELSTYKYLPEDFEILHTSLVDAKSVEDIQRYSGLLLSTVILLRKKLYQTYVAKPIPNYDNLKGWYEECWCNLRNKLKLGVAQKDKFYTFLIAESAQSYFDEMTERIGTKKYDVMQYFDSDNLDKLLTEFLKIMDEHLQTYEKVGRKVQHYDSFEALYKSYMKQ
ncbi:MAG: nucleotidyltransferase domain-containing protein [Defluviitaleaceae bacterium]|nr:nucleotidyltransferase domain-containing protein [Defluviitaleaceae bacterium]